MKRLTREKLEAALKRTEAALRDPTVPKDGRFRGKLSLFDKADKKED